MLHNCPLVVLHFTEIDKTRGKIKFQETVDLDQEFGSIVKASLAQLFNYLHKALSFF